MKKEINLEDIFKPNPHNIDPKKIKVGDMFWKSMYGVIFITEVISEEEAEKELQSPIGRFHGKPMFKFKKLMSDEPKDYTITEKSFTDNTGYLAPVKDSDIIKEMLDINCRYPLSDKASLILAQDEKEGGIYLSSTDSEGWVSLSQVEAKELLKQLKRFVD